MRTEVAVLLLLLLVRDAQGNLQQVIAESEAGAKALAAAATARVNKRWESLSSGECNICSIPACGTSFPSESFECSADFGFNKDACTCAGVTKSTQKSTVRFAQSTDRDHDPEVPAFVCASELMTPSFINNTRINAIGYGTQLIGHRTGVTRVYPGFAQDRTPSQCGNYDPRTRPWYATAASGPKDIVMVLDISKSMEATFNEFSPTKQTRLEAVKLAAKGVLDTLTANDFVSVIVFSDYGTSLQGQLVRATRDNVYSLKNEINWLNPVGGTNFASALNLAFDELEAASRGEGTTSGCTRVIQFLSDGENTDSTNISELLRERQSNFSAKLGLSDDEKPVRMFTYSMTDGSNSRVDALPKAMACENEGIWSPVRPGRHPFEQMTSYFQFLAAGISAEQVRWTNPYDDAFGRGKMVTAAMPIYEDERPKVLVGVVGIDVTMESLEKYGSEVSVLNELTSRGKQCPKIQLTFRQLQVLRAEHDEASKCPETDAVKFEIPKKETRKAPNVNDLLCERLNSNGIAVADDGSKSFGDLHCCAGCKKDASATLSTNTASVLLLLVLLTVFI